MEYRAQKQIKVSSGYGMYKMASALTKLRPAQHDLVKFSTDEINF